MKFKISHYQPAHLAALLIVFNWLCISAVFAQQTTSTPSNSGTSAITYKVIDSKKVHAGDHVITLNRVVPPVLPTPTPTPVSIPTPLTADQLRAIQAWEAKAHKLIMLEATVYDHQTTEVRWYDAGRQSIVAFSNIDFSCLSGIANIETSDTVYEYWIMILDNETSASLQGDPTSQALLANARRRLPQLQTSPDSKSSYFVSQSTNLVSGTNDGIAALNALHSYYDANHATLIANYQKRTADYAAQQQYLKDHPPIPPNTVTNFWRIKK